MRRLVSLVLSLLLAVGCATTAGAASAKQATVTTGRTGSLPAAEQTAPAQTPAGLQAAQSLDQTAGVLVTEDPADYPNDQVLVMYTDGTCTVQTYPDDTALAAALDELAGDETVSLVQPNYTYENQFLSTSDALVKKQWARPPPWREWTSA